MSSSDTPKTHPVRELGRSQYSDARTLVDSLQWLLNHPETKGSDVGLALEGTGNQTGSGGVVLTGQTTTHPVYGDSTHYVILLLAEQKPS